MRIYILMAAWFFASCSGNQEKSTEISGTLKNAPNTLLYLELVSFESGNQVVDSVTLKDGKFLLNVNTKEESLIQLSFPKAEKAPMIFAVSDKNKIVLNGDWNDFSKLRYEGSPASERLRVMLDSLSRAQQMVLLLQASMSKDSVSQLLLAEQAESKLKEINKYIRSIAEKDESPIVSLFAASLLGQELNLEETEAVMNQLQKRFPKHIGVGEAITTYRKSMELMEKSKAASEKIAPGALAPDLTMPDPDGKPVSISSFRGKYVLVDFWASWCGPCREENPYVVDAYKKFKDKNFTVLGVSLDKEKEPWLQAIQADNLTWTHMSDLKFWNSPAVSLYGISGIPFNVLLDPEGKIIAKSLRGENLEKTLEAVLNKP